MSDSKAEDDLQQLVKARDEALAAFDKATEQALLHADMQGTCERCEFDYGYECAAPKGVCQFVAKTA